MGGLVRVDIGAVLARVRDRLCGHPEVEAAVLFGSATGLCRPDSDIDIGVIRPGAAAGPSDAWDDLGLAEELADALGRMGRHVFHVTVLSLRSPFLAFEALRADRPALIKDEGEFTDFIEAVALLYREDYPRYLAALQDINA